MSRIPDEKTRMDAFKKINTDDLEFLYIRFVTYIGPYNDDLIKQFNDNKEKFLKTGEITINFIAEYKTHNEIHPTTYTYYPFPNDNGFFYVYHHKSGQYTSITDYNLPLLKRRRFEPFN